MNYGTVGSDAVIGNDILSTEFLEVDRMRFTEPGIDRRTVWEAVGRRFYGVFGYRNAAADKCGKTKAKTELVVSVI